MNLNPVPLTPNALKIFEARYSRKDADGNPTESVSEVIERVALNVASVTALYEEVTNETRPFIDWRKSHFRTAARQYAYLVDMDRINLDPEVVFGNGQTAVQEQAQRYADMIARWEFLPNSPTWTGAGTPLGQLSACLTGDAMVSTMEGLIPIREVVRMVQDGDRVEVVAFDAPEDFSSAYVSSARNLKVRGAAVIAAKSNGVRRVVRVTTNTGHSLTLTGDHRVWASDGEGSSARFSWMDASELRPGHQMMVDNREGVFADVHRDDRDASMAALFGWLQTDGFVGQYGSDSPIIEFETINDAEFEWISHHLDVVGWRHGNVIDEDTGNPDITYRRIRFYGAEKLQDLTNFSQVILDRKASKSVPDCLFGSPEHVVSAYLRSVFQADGHVFRKLHGFELATVSREFAHGLQLLLSQFGITSRVKPSGEKRSDRLPGWKVMVMTHPGRQAFEEKIGFISESKSDRLRASVALGGNKKPPVSAVRVARVEDAGEEEVFDIQTECETFWANRLAVHNCFVLPITDDLGRQRDSIMQTMVNATLIQQTGGGNGFSFGDLRPRGALVKASMGQASGPVSFMYAYDAVFKTLQQGGSRRGANMGILPIHHPDIREFIEAKTVEGAVEGFNISVAITDEFMRAVQSDLPFDLHFDGKVYETIQARDLFDQITQAAWKLGDPGCIFIDTGNRANPCPTRYTLKSTNPCYGGSTKILTRGGLKSISDVTDGGAPSEVLCGDGEWRFAQFWVSGYKPLFRVSLANGTEIDLTENHQVFVERDGSSELVEVSDLRIGDKVRPMLGDGDWIGSTFDWCTEDDLVVAGLVQGDGFMVNRSDRAFFKMNEPEVREFLSAWSGEGFLPGSDLEGSACSISGARDLLTKLGFDFMENGGLLPRHERQIPKSIFTRSPQEVRAFLRGLFSANGSAMPVHRRVSLKTTSRGEAMDVRRLLSALGFNAYITTTGETPVKWENGIFTSRESYAVNIGTAAGYAKFQREIGFIHDHKSIPTLSLAAQKTRVTSVKSIQPIGASTVYDFNVLSDDPSVDVHSAWVEGIQGKNCGEQLLADYESCCLGSIAVNRFVDGHYLAPGGASFDWERFAETIWLAVDFLDDVIDANGYVKGVPELEIAAQNGRRIGLGPMGIADAMLALGIPYGSLVAEDFLHQLGEFMRFHALAASARRAQQRGPFPWIENSIYDPKLLSEFGEGAYVEKNGTSFYLWSRPRHHELSAQYPWQMPELDWDQVSKYISKHGVRNSCQQTIAPTGTISNVAMLEGSGCEPLFALSYVRTMMQEEKNVRLDYLSPSFELALELAGCDAAERKAILDKVMANNGSCQGIPEVPTEVSRVFVVAADIEPYQHVRMQSTLQEYTSNAISKTINFPNSATVQDVADVYLQAYNGGCKGITIYRQGSRELEVLTTKTDDAAPVEPSPLSEWPVVRPLPIPASAAVDGLSARVFPVDTYFGKLHVTITELDDHPGRPFDIRLQLGKAGNDTNAHVEGLGRMISLALRLGASVESIVSQLEGIGGMTSTGFGPRKVRSAPDGVAKLLRRRYLQEESPVLVESVTTTTFSTEITSRAADPDTVCPECHNATLIFSEGCRKCSIERGGCGIFSGCD